MYMQMPTAPMALMTVEKAVGSSSRPRGMFMPRIPAGTAMAVRDRVSRLVCKLSVRIRFLWESREMFSTSLVSSILSLISVRILPICCTSRLPVSRMASTSRWSCASGLSPSFSSIQVRFMFAMSSSCSRVSVSTKFTDSVSVRRASTFCFKGSTFLRDSTSFPMSLRTRSTSIPIWPAWWFSLLIELVRAICRAFCSKVSSSRPSRLPARPTLNVSLAPDRFLSYTNSVEKLLPTSGPGSRSPKPGSPAGVSGAAASGGFPPALPADSAALAAAFLSARICLFNSCPASSTCGRCAPKNMHQSLWMMACTSKSLRIIVLSLTRTSACLLTPSTCRRPRSRN
mmetsp:Transcript_4628/g.16201  ORF Transcript_4628/g.16201 Transcript_4628/m.16201 type:complete len:342 (+) Transcript_4628:370-1395(+)